MASNLDITMRQFNGVDYDTLYPKTTTEQINGIDNYATKTYVDNAIATNITNAISASY